MCLSSTTWHAMSSFYYTSIEKLTPSRPSGIDAPGTDAPVDIYGHDAYPLGMNCTDPRYWADDALPTSWRETHLEQSPSTPYMVSSPIPNIGANKH